MTRMRGRPQILLADRTTTEVASAGWPRLTKARPFGAADDRRSAGLRSAAQDGAEVALNQFRGKAVAITFIFASCSATCPILTAKMASVQTELGSDFGSKIVFLSITVDPEHDTPDVLQRYARTFGADPVGWKFLTGPPAAIQDIERRYGVSRQNRRIASWTIPI